MITYKKIKNGKQLNKLILEYKTLRKTQSKLPKVKLDKPYFKDWKVIPILREDVHNRSDADKLEQLLVLGFSSHIIRNVNTVRSIRKGNYTYIERVYDSKKKRYYFVEKSHVHRKKISVKEYERIPACLQRYFLQIKDRHRVYYRSKFPKYYVKLKVRKNMVYYERMLDPIIESRMHEIENYLTTNNYWHLMYYYSKNRHWNYDTYYKFKKEGEILKFEKNCLLYD